MSARTDLNSTLAALFAAGKMSKARHQQTLAVVLDYVDSVVGNSTVTGNGALRSQAFTSVPFALSSVPAGAVLVLRNGHALPPADYSVAVVNGVAQLSLASLLQSGEQGQVVYLAGSSTPPDPNTPTLLLNSVTVGDNTPPPQPTLTLTSVTVN